MMQPPNKLSFLPCQDQSREGSLGTLMAERGGGRLRLVPCSLGTALKKKNQVPKQLKKHKMLHILSINKQLEKSRLENTWWNKVKLLI